MPVIEASEGNAAAITALSATGAAAGILSLATLVLTRFRCWVRRDPQRPLDWGLSYTEDEHALRPPPNVYDQTRLAQARIEQARFGGAPSSLIGAPVAGGHGLQPIMYQPQPAAVWRSLEPARGYPMVDPVPPPEELAQRRVYDAALYTAPPALYTAPPAPSATYTAGDARASSPPPTGALRVSETSLSSPQSQPR